MITVMRGGNIPDEKVDAAFQRHKKSRERRTVLTERPTVKKGDRVLVVHDGSDATIHEFIQNATEAGAEVIVELTSPRKRSTND